MKGLGIFLTLAGLGVGAYGFILNNDIEAQFTSLLSSGTLNPGTPWIIGGVAGIIIGVIIILCAKKSN